MALVPDGWEDPCAIAVDALPVSTAPHTGITQLRDAFARQQHVRLFHPRPQLM